MMKCFRERGIFSCPAGLALAGVGVVAIAAVQWPIAQAVLCEARAEASAATETAPAADEPEAEKEAVPEETRWRQDLTAALAESAERDKPVLAYFTAEWCPPCQIMKQEVWPREEVRQRLHEDYIPVMLDVDQPENAPAAQRYGIRAIPTILVLNAQGEVQQTGNFMPTDAMVRFLDQASGRS